MPYRAEYIEPFGGRGGVLLGRRRSGAEWLNDLDPRVANWWLMVRDRPAELAAECGRWGELEPGGYEWAAGVQWDRGVMGAVAFAMRVCWSFSGKALGRAAGNIGTCRRPRAGRDLSRLEIFKLSERVRGVRITAECGAAVLSASAERADSVVYVDPPYSGRRLYEYSDFDRSAVAAALLRHSGAVVVSGYGDEWDFLGWRRREHSTHSTAGIAGDRRRVEVAWLNF